MSKKLLALAVSAAMLAGVLAGCGDTSKETTDSSDKSTASDTVNKTDSKEKEKANSTQESQVIQVPVTIVNNTDVEFYELYTSGAGIDNWGDSILPSGQKLSPGTQLGQIKFNIDKDNLKWDLLAKDCNGDSLEFYGLDLSNCNTSGITISLSYDRNTQTGTITAQ